MRFNVKDLKKALTVHAKISRNGTTPILGSILLDTRPGDCPGLRVRSTDLELFAETLTDADGWFSGAFTVQLKALREAVKPFKGTHASLTVNGARLQLSDGSATRSVPIGPPDDYPDIPEPEGSDDWERFERSTLARVLGQTVYAASTDETRYNLNGVHFRRKVHSLEAIATDGHRLALSRTETACATPMPESGAVTVPIDWARLVLGTLASAAECKRKNAGPIRLALYPKAEAWAVTAWGTVRLTGRTDQFGDYPDVDQVIPAEGQRDMSAVLDRVATLDAARALAGATKAGVVAAELEADRLVLRVEADEASGEASAPATPCDKAKGLRFGISARYLADALEALEGDRVLVTFGAEPALEALAFRSCSSPRALAIVMPARLA